MTDFDKKAIIRPSSPDVPLCKSFDMGDRLVSKGLYNEGKEFKNKACIYMRERPPWILFKNILHRVALTLYVAAYGLYVAAQGLYEVVRSLIILGMLYFVKKIVLFIILFAILLAISPT